jgi:3-oxoacyl-[acyl-carrier-protein] synthase III
LALQAVLKLKGYGAWNGGSLTDNTMYEGRGMFFKNGIPVDRQSIEERIGIRTRMVAPRDVRIGKIALQDLIASNRLDPSRIKIIIGATNVGEDKYDRGPLIQHPYEIIKDQCPGALPFDLYAGCPGYNVAVELVFVLSLAGLLKAEDISVVVGAENIHRAQAFKPLDTANIIFGDDAMAAALETQIDREPSHLAVSRKRLALDLSDDFITGLAQGIFDLAGTDKIDGFIVDNQVGTLQNRVPATAARVQHQLVELMYPAETAKGTFRRFKSALTFYDKKVDSFAYDIMSLSSDAGLVQMIADAYVRSGKCRSVVSVFLASDLRAEITLHQGQGFTYERPQVGIIDTRTRTHGCFAEYIQVIPEGDEVFGDMDGKGVFLYATRSAKRHMNKLLGRNALTINDIDLLIEHQANFAIIPITLEQVLENGQVDLKKDVMNYVANKMITNVHTRGNCSVVCMQRLPYDLGRGALQGDEINGYPVNRNLEGLKNAKLILNDSVGAGMTRSSFLQRKD